MVAKDHSLLLTLLLAPLLYAFFYGSIYQNKVEEEVKLALVDEDRTELSRTFAQQLNNTQIADIVHAANLEDAQHRMYEGECQGYLVIPAGTQQKILSLQQAHIVLAVNAARFLPSSELAGMVTQVALTVGAGVRLQYNEKATGLNQQMALQEAQPVNIDYRPLFNTQSSYGAFLLPGLLALILQQTLLIGLSESVALEKQRKQVPGLVQQAGGSYSVVLWGKGAFYLLLFCCYAAFFMTVNFTTLELPFRGRPLDVGIALVFFLLTLIPLGVWLGTLFSSQLLAAQLLAFSTYPVFLVTGYAWPYESLPRVLQWFSALLPTTPFFRMYVSIVQAGGTLQENLPSLIHLLVLWIFYAGLALLRVRKLYLRQSAE